MYLLLLYLLPISLIFAVYLYRKIQADKNNKLLQKKLLENPSGEPASLHPAIDPLKCIGCDACVKACPEQNVLGVVNGKGQLLSPGNCIGHGACQAACPVEAISLVFGTEKRGVDIPFVKPNFETNVPGVFIAGELGGMGLIRNATEQGRQAMEAIIKSVSADKGGESAHDVVIVGAGPAGFAASLAAVEKKINYVTIEQETLGGAVAHFPRGKVVMTQPAKLPIIGKVHFRETTKESLLSFWKDAEKKSGVKINYSERVEKISREGNGFIIATPKNNYKTKTVLLAIGRRGSPRKLGVPGEQKEKVLYSLVDPFQYRGQNVLVVGGGDSALEAAVSLAEVPETKVILSYRGEGFSRVKEKNRAKLDLLQKQGKISVILNSNVKEVRDQDVVIDEQGKVSEFKNDAVIVCAGGVLPTAFLKEIGVEIETKYGTR